MFAIRTLTRTAAATAALVLAAGAASASISDPVVSPKAANARQSEEAATDSRRYCVVAHTTGSLLAKKECRTRAEWIARTGSDPAAKK